MENVHSVKINRQKERQIEREKRERERESCRGADAFCQEITCDWEQSLAWGKRSPMMERVRVMRYLCSNDKALSEPIIHAAHISFAIYFCCCC